MKNNSLKIDIDVATFKGLSSSTARMISVIVSMALFVALTGMLFVITYISEIGNKIPSDVMMVAYSILLMQYIVSGRSVLTQIAGVLVNAMPMSVLFRRDIKILDRGRTELERVLSSVDLATINEYSALNPSISVSVSDELIDVCRRGELKVWLNDPKKLASAANLIYQVYITDEFVSTCG